MITSLVQRFAPGTDLGQSFFPPPTEFNPDRDIQDLTGKVFLVTGGSSGIGKETCRGLVAHGGKVYLAGRSQPNAEAAIDQILAEVGQQAKDRLLFHHLDLGQLKAVKSSAEAFLAKELKVDGLFNNAGVMMCPVGDLTADGYDMQFGTNVLGHYLFTKLLASLSFFVLLRLSIPALLRSTEASGVPARIINLSSSGHKYTAPGSGFDVPSLSGGPERDELLRSWGVRARFFLYGQSKLGNIFLTDIFAAAHPADQLVAVSVHPGAIDTELARHVLGSTLRSYLERVKRWLVFPARMGAFNSLWAGVVAAPDEVNGKYVIPWLRVAEPSDQARDVETREAVRRWLEKQLMDL